MLYDMSIGRPPKAGSLKEALFLTVWLRRQEQKVYENRIVAQGMADVVSALKGESHVDEVFQKYTDTVFPFLIGQKKSKEAEVKELLERESQKGIITFKAATENFVKQRVKTMQMDDEWARKLRERTNKRKQG